MRAFIRHPLGIPIHCSVPASGLRKEKFLGNLSPGGLCFTSDEPVSPGNLIQIEIELTTEVFTVTGLVIWCNPQDSARYDVGVKFADEAAEFAVRLVEQACYIREYQAKIEETEGRILSTEDAAKEWIGKNAASFPR